MRLTTASVLAVLAFTGYFSLRSANSATKPQEPLTATFIPAGPAAKIPGAPASYSLQVRNVGAKEIVGLTMSVSFVDDTGRVRGSLTIRTTQFHNNGRRLLQGATLPMRPVAVPVTKDHATLTPRAEVDYVLFEDLTGWGPDTMKTSAEMIAFVKGARATQGPRKP